MKKKLILILSSLILFFVIIFVDYSIAKSNKSKPLFSINNYNSKQQMKIYTGLFYKIYTCKVDDGIYEVKGFFSKVNSDFCPRKYKLDFKNGYYINQKNIKISKAEYNKLNQFYSTERIVNMDEKDLKNAIEEINELKPMTK